MEDVSAPPGLTRRAFVAGGVAAAALAATRSRARASVDGKHIVFAYVPLMAAAPAMIASGRGYFADEGLDVSMVTVTTAQDAVALLARGRIDAAMGGASAAFFNAVHRGFKVRMAAGLTYIPLQGHPTALMARTDLYQGGLHNPQQLRGERIGIVGGLGTTSSFYLGKLIWPLTFNDIDMIPLNGGDQGVALRRKSIAAAFAWNPFTQAFERNGIAKIIAVPMRGTSTNGLFYGPRLLEDKGLAKAVYSAMNRAVDEIAGDGYYAPRNAAIFSKLIGTPAEQLVKDDRYLFKAGMPIDRKTLESMQQLFILEKTLAYETPLPDTRLIVEPA